VLGDEFDVEEELEATQAGGLIETETPEPEVPEEADMPEQTDDAEDDEEIPD